MRAEPPVAPRPVGVPGVRRRGNRAVARHFGLPAMGADHSVVASAGSTRRGSRGVARPSRRGTPARGSEPAGVAGGTVGRESGSSAAVGAELSCSGGDRPTPAASATRSSGRGDRFAPTRTGCLGSRLGGTRLAARRSRCAHRRPGSRRLHGDDGVRGRRSADGEPDRSRHGLIVSGSPDRPA